MEEFSKLPFAQKVAILFAVLGLVGFLLWFSLISPVEEEIASKPAPAAKKTPAKKQPKKTTDPVKKPTKKTAKKPKRRVNTITKKSQ